MTRFFITRAVAGQIETIKQIIDNCIGQEYFTTEELEYALSAKDHFLSVITTADKTVVGYSYHYILPKEEALAHLQLTGKEVGFVSERVGITKSLGIVEEYRKSGLATQLLCYGVEELFANGTEVLLGCAWKKRNDIPISGVFKELGFTFLFYMERPWYNMEMKCPFCKQPHCVCDGAVYRLDKTAFFNRQKIEGENINA